MRFDGYGAYIEPGTTTRNRVLSLLSEALQTEPTTGPTLGRWGPTLAIEPGGDLALWVGENTTGGIYVEGKGVHTPEWVSAIRGTVPHGAARLDACEDYDEADGSAFAALVGLVRREKGQRVYGGYKALPDEGQDAGRTWEAGKRGGTAYIRVYEPGKMKGREHLFAPTAARIEGEFRPHYARDKKAAASMSPLDVWGLTSWTHKVGCALTLCEITRFEEKVREYSYDKTTLYIARTFRRHLEEMLSNGEHLEATFRAIWGEDDAVRH